MNFLGSPPIHFPETRRLDASFPAILRDENAWRKVNDEFGQCLKEVDKGGELTSRDQHNIYYC